MTHLRLPPFLLLPLTSLAFGYGAQRPHTCGAGTYVEIHTKVALEKLSDRGSMELAVSAQWRSAFQDRERKWVGMYLTADETTSDQLKGYGGPSDAPSQQYARAKLELVRKGIAAVYAICRKNGCRVRGTDIKGIFHNFTVGDDPLPPPQPEYRAQFEYAYTVDLPHRMTEGLRLISSVCGKLTNSIAEKIAEGLKDEFSGCHVSVTLHESGAPPAMGGLSAAHTLLYATDQLLLTPQSFVVCNFEIDPNKAQCIRFKQE